MQIRDKKTMKGHSDLVRFQKLRKQLLNFGLSHHFDMYLLSLGPSLNLRRYFLHFSVIKKKKMFSKAGSLLLPKISYYQLICLRNRRPQKVLKDSTLILDESVWPAW